MMFNLKGNYFNGKFSQPQGQDILEKKCPGNLNQKLWNTQVDNTIAEEVVESAQAGYKVWRMTPLDERINILKKYRDIVEEKSEEIALAIAYEVGKPLWEARTEAKALANKVNITIDLSLKRLQNQKIENILPNVQGHLIYKPLGPTLIIGPFNFPCHLANGQIISALLMGNSIIFKPSEKTLFSAQLMFEALIEAGFPTGVLNFVIAKAELTQNLLKSKNIKGVFFTGSKNVGLKIKEATLYDLSKLVALELGGKNSSIVHHDTPMEHSLSELIKACFLTTGQRCTSTGTIFVHKKICQEFKEKFSKLSQRIHVDHPVEYKKQPFMGPLIDDLALKSFQNYIKNAQSQGAKLLSQNPNNNELNGYYTSPVIHTLEKVNQEQHQFINEEVFGPHCTIIPYEELDEAIELANKTEYGLAAALFTSDMSNYSYCRDRIEAGIFNCNRSTVGASSQLPFGGIKSSGNYRPAGSFMIDSCAYALASLETTDSGSSIETIPGLIN